jgi:trypsin
VADGQFPFMASIRNSGVHACNGALLSTRWVIFAAHCTRFLATGSTSIVVGSARLAGGTSYGVQRIVNHFDFTPTIMDDDISMLETSSTVTFSLI